MITRSEQKSFSGVQGFYAHESVVCTGEMRFAVYMPPAPRERVPVLYYLAGLTCTEETFVIKAGAQRVASELGIAIVTCDTSPRAARFPGDDAAWDFGLGAGFYVDATEAPWSSAYRMATYVTEELRAVVEKNFPVSDARGIFGHSMGGHGALVLALRNPGLYRSVSALAPIVAPSRVPWGEKAFSNYLGSDRARWHEWDATELARSHKFPGPVLIDQGMADKFLERELRPELLEEVSDVRVRRHEGYDHSYYFIATFVEDHLRHHARILCGS